MKAGIGIDIGGTKMLGLVLGADNKAGTEIIVKTAANKGYRHVMTQLKGLILGLLNNSKEEISFIGIALAGAVEKGRSVTFCPNLPFYHLELARLIEEEFALPCVLSNDVNAALLAEARMSAGSTQEVELGLFVGTGVGGAILIDGKLYEGRGGAGEFGHIRVAHEGRVCGCGKRGCLEAYASKTAMQNYIRQELCKGRASILSRSFESEEEGGMLKKGELLRAYQEGDKLALEVLEVSRKSLAVALVNLVNIFHPSCIILGGGIMEDFYDYYSGYLFQYIEEQAYSGFAKGLVLKKAVLGDRGAALGAAHMAREALLEFSEKEKAQKSGQNK